MDYQHVHGSDDPHDDLRYRQRTLQYQALVKNRVAQAFRPAGAPEAALGARACLRLRKASPSLGLSAALAALAGHLTGAVSQRRRWRMSMLFSFMTGVLLTAVIFPRFNGCPNAQAIAAAAASNCPSCPSNSCPICPARR